MAFDRLTVYAGGMVLLAMALLHTRGCSVARLDCGRCGEAQPALAAALLCLLVMSAVGAIYVCAPARRTVRLKSAAARASPPARGVCCCSGRARKGALSSPYPPSPRLCCRAPQPLRLRDYSAFSTRSEIHLVSQLCRSRALRLAARRLGLALGLVLGVLRSCAISAPPGPFRLPQAGKCCIHESKPRLRRARPAVCVFRGDRPLITSCRF